MALPLVIALITFIVAVGSTQIGVEVLRRSSEQMLHNQAVVFLDAVAGGIAQTIPEGQESVERQLNAALSFRTALLEEAIAVRWNDREGGVHTTVDGEHNEPALVAILDRASGQSTGRSDFIYDRYDETIAVARMYQGPYGSLALAALFDASSVAQTQRMATQAAIAIDIGVALLAALATFFLTRAMLAPLRDFTVRLAPDDIEGPARELVRGPEVNRLEYALLLREQSEAERATTASQMAQQERDAILARLAASIAHEVRNPLAGLKNGISTLKRFGHDEAVRKQSVELFDKGLAAIERVVDVTLSTYRRRSDANSIRGRDIRDLDLLLTSEARRLGVALVWEVDDAAVVTTEADALRQIVINLALNAIRATPPGGAVTISLSANEDVRIAVADTGPGMPAGLIASLVTGKVDDLPHERSLGIWMVANLVDRIGAHLSITSEEGKGTRIVIILGEKSAHPTENEP